MIGYGEPLEILTVLCIVRCHTLWIHFLGVTLIGGCFYGVLTTGFCGVKGSVS